MFNKQIHIENYTYNVVFYEVKEQNCTSNRLADCRRLFVTDGSSEEWQHIWANRR